ncbi:mandelate racemase [Pullulanibacillus camelliae]|uniref:Mandelate racemase n=1 Tax=Pullulanibacillus camelliae TaxID=1707096 RepID=A0A8J2Y9X7_9BACL|nr:mandelate racemase/muconate lactonizing enzyme family protein [Pullulanibacillus camelliae]GGE27754.1 mandelate racemase [Pullulanibacillus camelliae]
MKIIEIRPRVVAVPVKYPVVSCVRKSKKVIFVILDILTDEEMTGISYVQAFHYHGARAIKACINYLEQFLIGQDPRHIDVLWKKMWDATKLLGHQGLPTFAISLIDIALWDIAAKAANLPLYQFLGGERQAIEAYQSDGLWLESQELVCKQAEEFANQGFRTLKMRLGRANVDDDISLLKEIQYVLDDKMELLCDVNQGWDTEISNYMDRYLQLYGIRWIEEPIDVENLKGYGDLAKSMVTPLTFGENLYHINSFLAFLDMDNLKTLTPDLQRIGGITGWMKLNVLFDLYNKFSSIHLFPEIAVHLFPLIKKKRKLEWVTWATPLFKEPLAIENGYVQMPQGKGLCLEWDERAISDMQE